MAFKGLFQLKPFCLWKFSLFSITWTRTIQLFRATYNKIQQHLKTYKNLAELQWTVPWAQHPTWPLLWKTTFCDNLQPLKGTDAELPLWSKTQPGGASHIAQHQQGTRAGRDGLLTAGLTSTAPQPAPQLQPQIQPLSQPQAAFTSRSFCHCLTSQRWVNSPVTWEKHVVEFFK